MLSNFKFAYKGRNPQGRTVQGTIFAKDRQKASQELRKIGITPITIESLGERHELNSTLEKIKEFFGRPSANDLIIFSRQMYSLIKAGVPIIQAMHVVRDSSANECLKTTLTDMAISVESGKSLANAMAKHANIFPTLMQSLISIGENTGELDQVFKQISMHLQREYETKRRIKTAMRYPLMVIITIVIAIAVINLLVVPAFANFFSNFGADLPLPTKILIFTSNFTLNYWYLCILAVIVAGVSWNTYLHTDAGKMFWSRFKIKIPLIGIIIERSLLARFARSFSLTFKAGVPLLQAIKIIADTTDNVFIASKIMSMSERIERGESLGNAAKACGMFSTLVLQMIAIGEETGEVDKLLDEVADFYEQELEYDLKTLSSAVEPILIAVVAVMVLILALGVFLPMWDISQVAIGK